MVSLSLRLQTSCSIRLETEGKAKFSPFSLFLVFGFFFFFFKFLFVCGLSKCRRLDVFRYQVESARVYYYYFFLNKMSLRIKKRSSIEVRLRNLLTKGSIETDALQKIKTSFLWLLS